MVSAMIRRNDNDTRNQRDLYWVTSQGSDGSVITISSQQGTTAGVAYTLGFSGNDLRLSHSETGQTVDVLVSITGLGALNP